MKRILAPVILLLLICAVTACKKKNNGPSTDNLHIATIDYFHAGEIEHYRVVYDRYSNVDSIMVTGDGTALGHNGFKKFNYVGSSYNITDESNLTFSVYANTASQILKVLQADTLIMHYTGTQLDAVDSKIATLTPPYSTTTTIYYTWKNGDILSTSLRGGTATIYYYDMSRGGQAGDIWRVGNFIQLGNSYTKTAHLPKGAITGTDTVERYYYQFESTGRISQMIKVSPGNTIPDSAIYNYRYY